VARITHDKQTALLWLYQTPHVIRLPLGNSRTWFSDVTRTIPLAPFGYPHNPDLRRDLWNYAPQLRRSLQPLADQRD
jgi:hypothetical protein